MSAAQVQCGIDHTLILNRKSEVFSVGLNSHGQLGIGNARATTVPYPQNIQELNFQRIIRIRAGQFSGALSADL